MDAQWQRCVEAFLDSIEDISGSVRSRARYAYILHAFFTDPERNPDTYTQTEVQSFLNATSTSPRNPGRAISPSTKNNRLMALSSFYRFSATYEVDGDPLLKTKPPTYGLKYSKIGSSPKAMTANELEKFFSVIDQSTIKGIRDTALFSLFFWCGRRRSEIAHLLWGDLETTTIVEHSGVLRPGVTYKYTSKGHSRERFVAEMPQPAYQSLLTYLKASGRLDHMQSHSPLFVSTRPDQPEQQLTDDYLNALFKFYAAKAGLSAHYSLHSMRHTASRIRYESGQDIVSLKNWLGHSSLETTYRYVQSLSPVSDEGAKLLLPRFGHLGQRT